MTRFYTISYKKQLIFDGKSYISYDVIQLPPEYRQPNNVEQIHIKLRTKDPSGLLWYSGTSERNLHLSLKVN